MNNYFFQKLAADNIRKNKMTYIPYILTCILTVSMFYIIKSLSLNPGLGKMIGDQVLPWILFFGSNIVALFALVFLFYTNSFLIKRRKKEFGLFNILGMEKRHLAKTIAWETIYTAAASLTAGLLLGIAVDKLTFLLILKIMQGNISLGFFISPKAVSDTCILFAVIFFLIYINSVIQIRLSNPIELLQAKNTGEKEPKAKWLFALVGFLCIGIGYYLSITTEDPLTSVPLFFVAVLFVIAGTYLLFITGSIVFLKLLRRNKRYYYQTKHFISVSGMIYRMKQNAAGLANICILSTMVLVMISSTSALMLGLEEVLNTRYPKDFVFYSDEIENEKKHEFLRDIWNLMEEKQLKVKDEMQYTYLAFSSIESGDSFTVSRSASLSVTGAISNLIFVPLSDYNSVMKENKTLDNEEILLYSNRKDFEYPVLKVFDKRYTVKERLNDSIENGIIAANIANSHFIIVKDMAEIQDLYKLQKGILTDIASDIRYVYGFDTDADKKVQTAFYQALTKNSLLDKYQGIVESKTLSRLSFVELYGGLFFIGIFLGFLFLMAAVLIIYYKQISEGYDDRERFEIMQKVGMSKKEVKDAIHSQILTVFFLPLIVAGIHVAAAFPLISKLLAILNLQNTSLSIACTIVCFLAFTVIYMMIYLLTAKTYYRIVSK